MKPQPTEPVEVTQADRDAMQRLCDVIKATPLSRDSEEGFKQTVREHFAAHRVAAEKAALERVATVVKKWNFMACSDADGLVAEIRAEAERAALLRSLKVYESSFEKHLVVQQDVIDAIRALLPDVPDPQTGEK